MEGWNLSYGKYKKTKIDFTKLKLEVYKQKHKFYFPDELECCLPR